MVFQARLSNLDIAAIHQLSRAVGCRNRPFDGLNSRG